MLWYHLLTKTPRIVDLGLVYSSNEHQSSSDWPTTKPHFGCHTLSHPERIMVVVIAATKEDEKQRETMVITQPWNLAWYIVFSLQNTQIHIKWLLENGYITSLLGHFQLGWRWVIGPSLIKWAKDTTKKIDQHINTYPQPQLGPSTKCWAITQLSCF